ncbi:hypothetical protein, partial [Pseudomonas syringae group genomosp. 7]|uniref:hypothetical protein n=1 Tax=Pseudomonas syringae group genomosp. 7 TaxID=251699 RepID=UPI00376FED49
MGCFLVWLGLFGVGGLWWGVVCGVWGFGVLGLVVVLFVVVAEVGGGFVGLEVLDVCGFGSLVGVSCGIDNDVVIGEVI